MGHPVHGTPLFGRIRQKILPGECVFVYSSVRVNCDQYRTIVSEIPLGPSRHVTSRDDTTRYLTHESWHSKKSRDATCRASRDVTSTVSAPNDSQDDSVKLVSICSEVHSICQSSK